MNISPISYTEYGELIKKSKRGSVLAYDAAKMRRHEIERFYLQPISRELIDLDRNGAFRKEIRMFELLEGSEHQTDSWWLRLQGLNKPNAVLAIDVNTERMMRQVLQDLFSAAGVYERGSGFRCDVVVTRNSLAEFVSVCRQQRERIERLLDTSLRKDIDTKPTRQLGSFLGSVGLSLQEFGTRKEAGAKIYQYRVHAGQLAQVQSAMQRRLSEAGLAEWNELQRQRFPEEAEDAVAFRETTVDDVDLSAIDVELDAKADLYARFPEMAPTEPEF